MVPLIKVISTSLQPTSRAMERDHDRGKAVSESLLREQLTCPWNNSRLGESNFPE